MILRELLAPLGVLEEEKTAAQGAPPGPLDLCYVGQTADEHIDRLVQETISRLAAGYPRGAIPWCHQHRPDLVRKEQEILARLDTEDDAAFVQALREWETVQREMFAVYLRAQEAATRQTAAVQRDVAPVSWDTWLSGVEVAVCSDFSAWQRALAEARAAGVAGWDMETTGLDPLQNRIRLVQLAIPRYPANVRRLVRQDGKGPEAKSGAAVYVLDLFTLSDTDRVAALEGLATLVADADVVKVGHNLKFDLAFLRQALGRRLAAERLFDTMLASQLITAGDFVPGGQWEKWRAEQGLRPLKNEHGQELMTRLLDAHNHALEFEHDNAKDIRPFYMTHALQQIAHRHLEVWLAKQYQISDWHGDLAPEQIQYAALDAVILLPLHEILSRLLRLNRLERVAGIEFSCIPAVAEVELAGMPFDAPRARELLRQAEAEAARHRDVLAALAEGAGFRPRPKKTGGRKGAAGLNPDSGIDCVDCLRLLAEREGVLAENGRVLQVGDDVFDVDTRDDTLSRLAARLPEGSVLREFAAALRAYRAVKKRADFLQQWLGFLHPADDRLHPDLRQINPQGVGRFSARNPNLQQVPRGSDVRALFRAP
ncbi:MAG: hypothetical protein AB1816_11175, partial [Bacillota bacterium]